MWGKIFSTLRKLSEIVFLTSWTSNTVKQGVWKMSESVGNLAANFLQTPEVQSALQAPLCTALSSFQFCGLGFSRLVAHCHTSQSFEPSISLPNSHGASAHNQDNGKKNIASNFCKNPFAKYPLFQLLIFGRFFEIFRNACLVPLEFMSSLSYIYIYIYLSISLSLFFLFFFFFLLSLSLSLSLALFLPLR